MTFKGLQKIVVYSAQLFKIPSYVIFIQLKQKFPQLITAFGSHVVKEKSLSKM